MSLGPTPLSVAGARPGFTVTEVVAALGVLAVSISGAAFLMTSAFGTYRQQDRTMESRRLVHQRMERLTATDYAQLKQNIERARYAQDPPRSGLGPTDDFVTDGGGAATSRYELEPPKSDGDDWVPRPDPAALGTPGGPGMGQVSGTPDPRVLKATLQLQYWDPQFDSPAKHESGLIRASFTLSGPNHQDRAVKYFTR